jgi:hypothetical protein
MGMELTTMFSKSQFPRNLSVVYKAYVNPISVSVNLGQGLGIALSLGEGSFAKYGREADFPANCERAHVQFAGVYF